MFFSSVYQFVFLLFSKYVYVIVQFFFFEGGWGGFHFLVSLGYLSLVFFLFYVFFPTLGLIFSRLDVILFFFFYSSTFFFCYCSYHHAYHL